MCGSFKQEVSLGSVFSGVPFVSFFAAFTGVCALAFLGAGAGVGLSSFLFFPPVDGATLPNVCLISLNQLWKSLSLLESTPDRAIR